MTTSERPVREVQVTFDCADPGALSTFWGEVLGYPEEQPPPPFTTWPEALDAWGVPEDNRNDYSAVSHPQKAGPRLFFQKVPEPKTVKNRVHLDVRAAPGLQGEERMAALEAEAERLVSLGARRLERHEPGGIGAGHLVMADPEGNEFCLD
jgi:catechol 2,3-dioxygenase-like lactoylglutathione lyase family enzyme